MRRAVLAVLLAGTPLLLPLEAPGGTAPSVSVSPSRVAAGDKLTISGRGWPAGRRVQLLIGPPRSEADPIGSARVNRRGRFSRTLTISPRAKPGPYVVLACRRQCAVKAQDRVRITRSS